MQKSEKIYIAGHQGMVGSAIMRKLEKEGFKNIVYRSLSELDLRNQQDVLTFFQLEKPDYVILAAAKVGGIHANNTYKAEFIYDNLMIEANIINAAHLNGVKKLLFLGSSCIYPKFAPQPLKEEYLLTGALEPTNDAYALAKIAGIKMCESYNTQYGSNFISAMPTNLFGPNDNYNLKNSHVLPALIRKIYEAKEKGASNVELWGTGNPLREFLFVDDLADALFFLLENYNSPEIVNIGTGKDISIRDLAEIIKSKLNYSGELKFNPNMPDGTPRKLLDVSKIEKLGWKSKTSLEEGISITIKDFVKNIARYTA